MWNNFIEILINQSAKDIIAQLLDIFIVYYIIYRLLLIIKGTRTVPMAIGFMLIFVAYYVSRVLGLLTLYTLLQAFVSVIVIFFLIVFQDDIRRALIRVGRFADFGKAQQTQVIEEIIQAAINLAEKRLGGLIVIEREGRLDEFIEPGTTIDSNVNRELLYSIFIPSYENPLHDGAVIIRNFRIYQAGAFLPLSTNPKIDKTFGTRHRASIGITEQTDAVAVVVSEERGSISVCFTGHIAANLDINTFRKTLLALVSKKRKKESETIISTKKIRDSSSILKSVRNSKFDSIEDNNKKADESIPANK